MGTLGITVYKNLSLAPHCPQHLSNLSGTNSPNAWETKTVTDLSILTAQAAIVNSQQTWWKQHPLDGSCHRQVLWKPGRPLLWAQLNCHSLHGISSHGFLSSPNFCTFVFVCLFIGGAGSGHNCGSQWTTWNHLFSPSTPWIRGTELRTSALVASALAHLHWNFLSYNFNYSARHGDMGL